MSYKQSKKIKVIELEEIFAIKQKSYKIYRTVNNYNFTKLLITKFTKLLITIFFSRKIMERYHLNFKKMFFL